MSASIYDEFKQLIDTGKYEEPLQKFLETHKELLISTFNQGAYFSTVFPKFELGDELIPDFVMVGHRSRWSWDVNLIEIEPAILNKPLFNKQRQSTGRLRTAEGQIQDWQMWMNKHSGYFTTRMLQELKKIGAWDKKPQFYELSDGTNQSMTVWYRIVIGRRNDFQGQGDEYRRHKSQESGNRVEIVTWDRLLDKAKLLKLLTDKQHKPHHPSP